jgi:hypothetical protein
MQRVERTYDVVAACANVLGYCVVHWGLASWLLLDGGLRIDRRAGSSRSVGIGDGICCSDLGP